MNNKLIWLILGLTLGWFIRGVFLVEMQPSAVMGNDKSQSQEGFYSGMIAPTDIIVNSSVNKNPIKVLSQYLNEKKYDLALEIVDRFQQQNDFLMLVKSTKLIIKYSRQLISNREFDSALLLLNQYLALFNRNIEIRMILVELYSRLPDYLTAIDQLYIAKGHASTQDDINKINKKIRVLVEKQTSVFKSSQAYLEILKFYEKLTQQEADYAPYFMGLAKAQIELGYFEYASSSLTMILEDKNVGYQASMLLDKLKKNKSVINSLNSDEKDEADDISSISLINRGNNYYLDAFINETDSIRLLIDTGASLSVFTPQVLNKFNSQFNKTGEVRRFNTANGQVDANIYKLHELTIGEMKVSDIEIAVLDMQSNNLAEGLLGMNFLQYFQFYIDQDKKVLHLSLRN